MLAKTTDTNESKAKNPNRPDSLTSMSRTRQKSCSGKAAPLAPVKLCEGRAALCVRQAAATKQRGLRCQLTVHTMWHTEAVACPKGPRIPETIQNKYYTRNYRKGSLCFESCGSIDAASWFSYKDDLSTMTLQCRYLSIFAAISMTEAVHLSPFIQQA